MKILLTGATGLIGKELGKTLVAKGYEIVAISRNALKAREQLPFPCEVIEKDLVEGPLKENFRGVLDSVDAVINLMGESIAGGRWTEARKRKIYESRILSTRHLIESFSRAPKIFISGSAVGYYGSGENEEISEDHEPGSDYLAQLCQDWEEELIALSCGEANTRVVALRTGMVLSSRGGALEKMIPLFRKGLGGVLGNGRQWMSWIHIEDEVGIIVHALETASLEGPVNVVSPNPVTNEEFTNRLARALEVKVGPQVPRVALITALGELGGLMLQSQRVLPKKAILEAYKFKHPHLAESLQDVCRPYAEKMDYYSHEQYLPWKPEEVFPFFMKAENLGNLNPPKMEFKFTETPPASLQKGSRTHFQIKVLGVPVTWVARLEEWEPPLKFVDIQEKGPFSFWQHSHEFIPFSEGTLMVDKIRYRLPFGAMGELFGGHFARKDLEKVFAFRSQYILKNLKEEARG